MHLAKRLRAGLGLSCCAVGASFSLATAPGPATSSAISTSGKIAPAPQRQHPYAITPERQALLNTIRYAEGTWRNGSSQGYRILYGGAEFKSLAKHPDTVVVKRYASAAAGAYQFMPSTWALAAARLKLPDFGPSKPRPSRPVPD
jgi:lysozyme